VDRSEVNVFLFSLTFSLRRTETLLSALVGGELQGRNQRGGNREIAPTPDIFQNTFSC